MAKVYVGRIADKARERDIDDLFAKYGKLERIELKGGFGFLEFSDKRDAEDAVKALDGHDFMGSRLYVDLAFTQGELPDFHKRRRPIPGEGRCHRCGIEGHWARECPQNRDRSRSKDRDRDRDRDRGRDRSRSRDKDKDRRRDRSHSRDRDSHKSSRRRETSKSRYEPYPKRDKDTKRSPSPKRGTSPKRSRDLSPGWRSKRAGSPRSPASNNNKSTPPKSPVRSRRSPSPGKRY